MGNKKHYNFPPGYSMKNAILDILLDLQESSGIFDTPYQRMKKSWRRMAGAPEPVPWRYNRAMRYLEKREQIEITQRNDKLFVKLTRKGKIDALLLRLNRDFDKHEARWDGKWRVIIWDIPESANSQRQKIRELIKSLGFLRLQHSVFINPYPLPRSAVDYLNESGLADFIRFLRVDKIDNDKHLKKHFKLID